MHLVTPAGSHFFEEFGVPRCDTRDLELKALLGGETGQLKEVITRIKRWNSIVDEMYDDSDSEPSETEAPEPPSLELIFSKEESVPYSSRALYEILHQNWPCASDAHNHDGRLGLCFEANFCLDPRWASRN
ncbi:purine and uridine phosphorylase [Penicillium waksmanii]|uniref:purine and uridine phosphorylase n=1 Tax=Penicillium waksmanii TaxID=69791 RepID=UPI002548BB32|nr:purine and uridine phosphorylase [Penicillium waksmanii]KAJ5995493.1 purine and uridine phosphorylase [Penicillium waksmanii]